MASLGWKGLSYRPIIDLCKTYNNGISGYAYIYKTKITFKNGLSFDIEYFNSLIYRDYNIGNRIIYFYLFYCIHKSKTPLNLCQLQRIITRIKQKLVCFRGL